MPLNKSRAVSQYVSRVCCEEEHCSVTQACACTCPHGTRPLLQGPRHDPPVPPPRPATVLTHGNKGKLSSDPPLPMPITINAMYRKTKISLYTIFLQDVEKDVTTKLLSGNGLYAI